MLDNKALLVPKRIEDNGIIADTVVEIKPTQGDYKKYLKEYQREQELEKQQKK